MFGHHKHFGKDVRPLIRPPQMMRYIGDKPIDDVNVIIQSGEGELNACNGDAGAPLFYQKEGEYYWVGNVQKGGVVTDSGRRRTFGVFYSVSDRFFFRHRCGGYGEHGGWSTSSVITADVYQWLYGPGVDPEPDPDGEDFDDNTRPRIPQEDEESWRDIAGRIKRKIGSLFD